MPRRPAGRPSSFATPMIVCTTIAALVALVGICLYLNARQDRPESPWTDAGDRARQLSRNPAENNERPDKPPRAEPLLFSVDPNQTSTDELRKQRKKAMGSVLKALTAERWQEGLRLLEKLGPPETDPSSYYYWLGYACSGCKLDDRAVDAFHKAVEYNERNDSAVLQLGLAYGRLGWIKKAEKWLAKGMELCPDDPHFDFAYGHMYAGNGYLEKAREWFTKAADRGGNGPIGTRARSRLREVNRQLGID